MAERLNKRHTEIAKSRIRVGYLISKLQKHVAGDINLTRDQIQSAKILLDKSLSNAASVSELSGTLKLLVDNGLPPTALDK